MSTVIKSNANQVSDCLLGWLKPRVEPTALGWLEEKRSQISAPDRAWFSAFSAVPRYLGKQALQLSVEDLATADRLRPGWNPAHWSVDQVGRTLLILAMASTQQEGYLRSLDQLFANVDVGESVTLYQSLPILPDPEQHRDRAAEGVRSNMTDVFNAIALRNPYPADYLSENAWNQMILKAIFIGSPLSLIQGLDRRHNSALRQMLMDYAQERQAAKRTVIPEIWQLINASEDSLQTR
jgi:hypothetical protein